MFPFKPCIVLLLLFPFSLSSFQTSLLRSISYSSMNESVLFSPLSIYQSLCLVANGANGHTQMEILHALGSSDIVGLNQKNTKYVTEQTKTSLHIANAVFSKFQPMESFIEIAMKYKAKSTKLDSVDQVNQWCADNTNNKITHIIDTISDVELLFINAVYFKSNWKYAFDPSLTVERPFNNADGSTTDVKMMRQTHSYLYYESRSLQVVEMPYAENGISAVIMLPDDLNDFIESLNDSEMNKIFKGLKEKKVQLQLPRFEFESSLSLVNNLRELGIDRAFDKISADFTNITNHIKLHINKMIHKTYLQVNEEGSEAAAVTVTTLECCSVADDDAKEMIVDRPFLFMIKDKDAEGNMVFIAKIDNLK